MKNILITGSKGIVGKILVKGLKESYFLSLADLPEHNISSYETALQLTHEKDAVIHLAWNTKTEDGNAMERDPDNTKMFVNIYRACIENNVPRAIMASSVHATDYISLLNEGLVSPRRERSSKKSYGRHKRSLERRGEMYASKGLEVICVRLGGICSEKERTWKGLGVDGLAYPDLITLFKACIDAKNVPNNYVIMYGISKNKGGKFDLSNPFNWAPKFDAAEFYSIKN